MNTYIRFFLEAYLDLCLTSMLRLKTLAFGVFSSSFHSSLSIVILALLASTPIFTVTYLLCRKEESLSSERFQKRFGELVLDLKINNRVARLSPVLFMARRLAYAGALVYWLDRSVYQVQCIIVQCSFFVIYVGSVRPYNARLLNVVELTNETFTALCAYSLVTFSDFVHDAKTKYECGWLLVGATLFLIVFNLIMISYKTVAEIIHKCKLQCMRRRAIKMME